MTGVGGSGGESLRTVVSVTMVAFVVFDTISASESESESLEEESDDESGVFRASESVALGV